VFYGLVFCFVIAPWNRESFGFFIDFGNGMMTIPPSLLANIAIVWPDKVSPLWVGCIGLVMYWQVMWHDHTSFP
jgi:hypothetical protein